TTDECTASTSAGEGVCVAVSLSKPSTIVSGGRLSSGIAIGAKRSWSVLENWRLVSRASGNGTAVLWSGGGPPEGETSSLPPMRPVQPDATITMHANASGGVSFMAAAPDVPNVPRAPRDGSPGDEFG